MIIYPELIKNDWLWWIMILTPENRVIFLLEYFLQVTVNKLSALIFFSIKWQWLECVVGKSYEYLLSARKTLVLKISSLKHTSMGNVSLLFGLIK